MRHPVTDGVLVFVCAAAVGNVSWRLGSAELPFTGRIRGDGNEKVALGVVHQEKGVRKLGTSDKTGPDVSGCTIAQIEKLMAAQPPDASWLRELMHDSRVGVRQLAQRELRRLEQERRWVIHQRRLYRYQNWLVNRRGLSFVIGVDEAGRGPLAGPVFAAAVVLRPDSAVLGLDDSKKLSDSARRQLAAEIRHRALAWAVGCSDSGEIDQLNIRQATFLAMRRALKQISTPSESLVLVDGNAAIPGVASLQRTVTKGDARIASIAAASILAKVCRDDYMIELDKRYPNYGFAQHKGYGTKEHLAAIYALGPTSEHRRSFAPVESVQAKLFGV